jgi:hypothetical protein
VGRRTVERVHVVRNLLALTLLERDGGGEQRKTNGQAHEEIVQKLHVEWVWVDSWVVEAVCRDFGGCVREGG